ncbi:pimeloyl-ACP methyl esterase BioG family protein [Flammeovirga pacifica]|uniref:Uncharacterized protein n=1 Tax=Flammeovirga pacifica TaxID=915059 RepID=A0A1S1YVE5_FLAPC|nr:pimeloyl-ACP methyl esterase BioG family protein [Flammeovirga pacifica]OHX64992.1 hypothetical protein NH26_00820 [Flammeovirga pacifica]
MKYQWLNKGNNTQLVLFFSGWGQTASYFKNYPFSPDEDVLMIYHYSHLDFEKINQEVLHYEKVHCIAWSFGVLVAAHFLDQNTINGDRIGINGTLSPVDAELGIPPAIFNGTLNGLSEINWKKFVFRIFDQRNEAQEFLSQSDRTIDNLKVELSFLGSIEPFKDNSIFHSVFVSKNDRIFPVKNQLRAWENSTIEVIDTGHFPFHRKEFLTSFQPTSIDL